MLEGLEPPVSRNCKIARILSELEAKDKQILTTALADRDKWGSLTLSRALRSRGIDLSDNTINKHRRGECRCGK